MRRNLFSHGISLRCLTNKILLFQINFEENQQEKKFMHNQDEFTVIYTPLNR